MHYLPWALAKGSVDPKGCKRELLPDLSFAAAVDEVIGRVWMRALLANEVVDDEEARARKCGGSAGKWEMVFDAAEAIAANAMSY